MDVAATASTTTSAASTGRTTLSSDFDTFLKLLTTQLQYQDPTDPMDTAQFTQQLVQYSQVEQQINTNTNLESLLALQKSASSSTALGYLGKTATTRGPEASLSNGNAAWTYELPANATQSELIITDSAGRIVHRTSGQTTAGRHTFSWDGKDQNGAALSDGTYRLEVKARDANDKAIAASLSSSGLITEADLSTETPVLKVGGRSVPLTDILSIRVN